MCNNGKKSIGFVILNWNSEKVVGKCLESIVKLNYIFPYVVIVDNGSVDASLDIVTKYTQLYPDIFEIITYSRNRGTTISRNAGLKLLKNKKIEYYCILDSDTVISDESFLKLIEEMEKNTKYGIIGPKLTSADGKVQMSARAFPTLLEKICKAFPNKIIQSRGEKMEMQLPPREEMDSYAVDYLMSACWLIKPEVIEKVGGLDENIFYAPEDAEYCIRVWKSGYQVAYCPSAQIMHEWQRLSKNKIISKMNWEHIKGLMYMFLKHHYMISTDKLKKNFKY